MTIEQTVDIPADHRVFFEFLAPREIPAGKARVEVKVTPVVEKQTDQRSAEPALTSAVEGEMSHVDALLGILSQIGGNIDIDELRTERIMAKHLPRSFLLTPMLSVIFPLTGGLICRMQNC